jgi:hypothetical protein
VALTPLFLSAAAAAQEPLTEAAGSGAPAEARSEAPPQAEAPLVQAEAPLVQAEAPPWAAGEDDYADANERPPSSARTNLWITGGAVTVGFYGVAFGTSYLWPSSPVAEDLRIPVVGPYSAVFGAGCGDRERGCGTFVAVLRTTLAAISALGQTGGVLLLAEAAFLDTDSTSASSGASGRSATVQAPSTEPLFYAPLVDEDALGLIIGGSF